MKRNVLIGIGVLLAVIVAVGAYIFTTLDDQTASKVDDVLTQFRESAPPEQPARPGLPKQGVYQYTVAGKERIKSTISVDRTLPATATALVRHTAEGYEVETRYSKEHIETSKYRLAEDGSFVTFANTRLEVGPVTTVKERAWTPELLRLPLNKDATLGGKFKSGDLDLDIKTRLLPDEKVTVAGTPVDVTVVEHVQDIKGEYTGSRTETFWFSPKLGMIIRYTISSSLKGPVDFDFTADQTLASLDPQV